jgi:tRNA(Ile)-lysidine synthase TilS/MesJ
LIRARRDDIRLHLERHGIQFAEDPSNKDSRYLRSRVRHDILPALSRESPGIVRHLNSLADRMLELDAGSSVSPLGLARSQVEALRRIIQRGSEGAEIALAGGWVLKLERKRIRSDSATELP